MRHRAQLITVHQQAQEFFINRVAASWVPQYLAQRSLIIAAEAPWMLGHAPAGWTTLTDHLRGLGWSDDVLVASGLCRRSRTGNVIDHFRDRLTVPLRDLDGTVLAFVARRALDADDRAPKYLNSPRTPIYDKSSSLLGLAEGRDRLLSGAIPVLVEGPLDAVAIAAGLGDSHVGLAVCGTALSPGHVTLLGNVVDLAERGLVVALDADAAGERAAARAYEQLAPHTGRLLRARLPSGADPADLLHRLGAPALRAALSQDAVPLMRTVIDQRVARFADQLQWVQGRVAAARHVAPLLAGLQSAERQAETVSLARRLDLAEETVTGLVASAAEAAPRDARAPAVPVSSQRGRAGGLTGEAQLRQAPLDLAASRRRSL